MTPSRGPTDDASVNEATPMPSKPQVVVRVTPRLLGDVLCVALREKGLDAELHLETQPPSAVLSSTRFDLALVTGDLPYEFIADTIIVIDPVGSSLSVVREGDDPPLTDDAELSSLIGLIEGVLKDGAIGT